MKKWLMWIVLFFGVTACTTERSVQNSKTEKLHSFLIVQNKLYAVGELNDYEFSGEAVNDLNRFLQTPFAKKITGVNVRFEVEDTTKVKGFYEVEMAKNTLTESQVKQLTDKLGFRLLGERVIRNYSATGNLVKLANRNEILQKFRFKAPLEATLNRYETRQEFDGESTAALALLPITLPLAVVGAVVIAPFYLYSLGY